MMRPYSTNLINNTFPKTIFPMINFNYCHLFHYSKIKTARQIIRDARKEVEKHVYIENVIDSNTLDMRLFICVEGVRIHEILTDEQYDSIDEVSFKAIPVPKSYSVKIVRHYMRQYYNTHRRELYDKVTGR